MGTTPEPVDRFLHATDLHFWHVETNPLRLLNKRIIGNANVALRRRKEFLTGRAPAFAEHIASLGIPDIVLSGDFTSTALDAEFRDAKEFVSRLENAGLRPVAIAGNHDVYTFESLRHRRFQKYLGRWMPDEALPAIRRLPGGTPMLYVPTVCPNVLSSAGRISESEIGATAELLATLDEPVVVVGHYPLLDETPAYRAGNNRRLRNAESLRHVLGESGKRILYVCGHVHRFSFDRDATFDNLTHLATAALFRRDPETGHAGDFSEVRVRVEGYEVLRHRFEGAWRAQPALPN